MEDVKKKSRGGSVPGSGRKCTYDTPRRYVAGYVKEEVYELLSKEKSRSEIINKALCIYYGIEH